MIAQPPTVVVAGAGLTGLVAAHQLRRGLGPAARIIVADPDDRVGGKLRTVDTDEGPIEVGAEAYLGFRADATEFFEALGLGDELVEPSGMPSTIFAAGELRAMPRTTVMGVPASSRGLEGLLSDDTCARIDAEGDPAATAPLHWVHGDDVNLGQLVESRLGREVVDHLVSPLLGGVYSCLADDLGLRATVPQLAGALDAMTAVGEPVSLTAAAQRVLDQRAEANEARLASGAVSAPIFRTFRNGYRKVYDALVEQAAPELVLGAGVEKLSDADGGKEVTLSDGRVLHADAVVLAAPAPVTGALLSEVAPDAADIIGGIDLASSAVVAMRFATDEGLPEYSGILVAADAGMDAKAFTFSSRKWPHLGERGGAIVRGSFGRFGDDSLVKLSDGELTAKALADLETLTGFAAEPAEVIVQRWWGGIPRYGVGHGDLMRFADAALDDVPRVAAAGAWHRGPGIPACLTDAKAAAAKIIRDLA
ncbi:protoporphyrinogen oxidase [Corynebacterium hansenii]|uniref:Coproporphyrinogen III oxidase n=1 Tax=Corynebacterium hansenii TaxID=394964 RepID=A0ABV7ZR38_9CORY|nr:protoporphyrinogen oxidase [Corynebacterium hansenii]WJY99876.1 Protoporphyrinogen oxidase [Corynebacterium hansenii]